MNILFAAAEAWPLAKTGGLGDVCGSLPLALRARGHDVRLILPAYPQAVGTVEEVRRLGRVFIGGVPDVSLLGGLLPGTELPVYLVDCPALFDRPGRPYGGPDGDWPDNALRFATFSRAVARLSLGQAGQPWTPDVVHSHDWHTGLVSALLALRPGRLRPATVFTVHNLAYQGLFPHQVLQELGLPESLWTSEALEFHDQLSFIKGGLVFADRVTTVSPTYAEEIRTPALGCGLDGVLRARGSDLLGILNGADYDTWNPKRDEHIAARYGSARDAAKVENKRALQRRLGLPQQEGKPLFAFLARLVEQKGVEQLLEALPELAQRDLQVVVVGEGERRFGHAFERAARQRPDRLGVSLRYTEELAHQVIAGADALLMPSRFEPCGLTQIYALRYGTVPVVHRTGGLADTVVSADARTLGMRTATGFSVPAPKPSALLAGVDAAVACHTHPAIWRQLQRTGMAQDFSWGASAKRYEALYRDALRRLREPAWRPSVRSRGSGRGGASRRVAFRRARVNASANN